MAYHPVYDLAFDVAADALETADHFAEFLESLSTRKLVLTAYTHVGPGGGNPAITIRGTKNQLVSWARGYYDPDELRGRDDRAVWEYVQNEIGGLDQVA